MRRRPMPVHQPHGRLATEIPPRDTRVTTVGNLRAPAPQLERTLWTWPDRLEHLRRSEQAAGRALALLATTQLVLDDGNACDGRQRARIEPALERLRIGKEARPSARRELTLDLTLTAIVSDRLPDPPEIAKRGLIATRSCPSQLDDLTP